MVDDGPTMPSGPPASWPGTGAPGPVEPPAPARARRRWPWVAAAGVVVAGAAGVVGAVALTSGGDDDEAYCAALGTLVRDDVEALAFILPTAGAGTADRVEQVLRDRPEVSDLRYVDADESLAEAQELFEDSPTMQDLLRPEDVPTSWRYTVPDPDAARVVEEALGVVDHVQVEDSSQFNVGFLDVTRLLADETYPGGPGRLGHVVAPARVERLRETAPDGVAAEVDLVIEALNEADDGAEERHVRAAEAVLGDAEERCP